MGEEFKSSSMRLMDFSRITYSGKMDCSSYLDPRKVSGNDFINYYCFLGYQHTNVIFLLVTGMLVISYQKFLYLFIKGHGLCFFSDCLQPFFNCSLSLVVTVLKMWRCSFGKNLKLW